MRSLCAPSASRKVLACGEVLRVERRPADLCLLSSPLQRNWPIDREHTSVAVFRSTLQLNQVHESNDHRNLQLPRSNRNASGILIWRATEKGPSGRNASASASFTASTVNSSEFEKNYLHPLVVAAVAIEITEFHVLHMISPLHPSGSKKNLFVVIAEKVRSGAKWRGAEIETFSYLSKNIC